MNIDWNHFSPWTALYGGGLIGIAASFLILLIGRIAGICGIVGGLLRPGVGDVYWRIAFIAGILGSPWIWQWISLLPDIQVDTDYPVLVIAGLLVGIGTRYGSGCTSGHGVCGIARLSPRSIVATLSFMLSGFLTVFVVRHLIG
jgi:uncharacterized membrane protein YedE/YeeE